jgi:hypothetical protein
MLFQNIKDRIHQIRLGSKLDGVPGIPGNFTEEFFQVLGHFKYRNPVILDMVFLLENDAIKAGSKDLFGWLVKLFRENIWVQVVFILTNGGPSSQLPGND